MKKLFEIEWDEELLVSETDFVQEALTAYFGKMFKVTEIKPINFCYTPMSIEKKYCECDKNLGLTYIDSEGVEKCCIKTCNKPIKPKSPIEKILDFVYSPDTTGFNMSRLKDKINQIIDWIGNHSKEA